MFLGGKGVLKIYSKFTGELSIQLQSKFIKIELRYGCSPVNVLYMFRTPFPKNTSGGLLLVSSFKKEHQTIILKGHFIVILASLVTRVSLVN